MRRHLNTLYVTTQGAWVSKDGANIVVSLEGKEVGRVPMHNIGALVCFGRVLVSPPLMGACAEAQVTIAFLTEEGRFLARVVGPQSGNVLLRREQYRRADAATSIATVARAVVIGKVLNQRAVLRRALRDHGAIAEVETVAERMTEIARRAETCTDVDTVRGLEGEAANLYFGVFDQLIVGDKDTFRFTTRSRRPPLDRVNALLSFIYALLAVDTRAAAEAVGLDPSVGYLHRDRPGRHGLALDLMEEFRPFFADRLALSLINRRQLTAKDFRAFDSGAVLLTDEGRKTALVAYQERKREELEHAFVGEKVTVGLLWHVQAQLMARHVRGDLDGYPPFVWR